MSSPEQNPAPLPMREPPMASLQLCPVCHGTIRGTAELCPHCGAERHFGATLREAILGTGAGMLLGVAISVVLRADLLLTCIAVPVATILGFALVQNRHGARWIPKASGKR